MLLLGLALLACSPGPVKGGPAKRIYAESAWDEAGKRMIIFEGQLGPSVARADSWAWDPAKHAWKQIAGLEGDLPTCAMDYYASADTLVCFVGSRWTSTSKGEGRNVSETWIYDATTDNWKLLETVGSPTPGLLGSRVAYSKKADRLVLFGGLVFFGTGGWKNETWVFDLAARTWTLMNPPESPPSRNYFQMAYDEKADRFIVFGSDHGAGGSADLSTWSYDLVANVWTKIEASAMPEPLVYADMVYVPELEGCLLFGGVTGLDEKPRNGTWLFVAEKGWSKLAPQHAPSPRAWHSMAWDPISKRVWLYGGGPRRNMPMNELWYWDLAKRDWFQIEREP